MNSRRRKNTVTLVATGLCFFSQVVSAVLFEPGVGLGLEYTDNATLTDENRVNDLITTAYVGANLSEDEGALTYDAAASFNNTGYTQDTFSDRRYFNLGASADWEMVKERFNWFISDTFSQATIRVLDPNTPDNLQDTNAFTFGANIRFPISARQNFSLIPMYNQYYYEILSTDNKQYSLAANWNYQMFRLTNVGLNLSVREINYTEIDILGRTPEDTTFTNMAIVITGNRLRSSFTTNLGATNVKREGGEETTGFAGHVNWSVDLSSSSRFETLVSSDLTDASSVTASGGGSNVEVTADVIRSSNVDLVYLREDVTLNTRISARYNKVDYSESLLDREIRVFDLSFTYPVTQLLSSGVYMNYNRTKQLDVNRLDDLFTVGANVRYNFSRKIHGLLDLKTRTKESNFPSESYDEISVFASLVYGFGDVRRATRAGGF